MIGNGAECRNGYKIKITINPREVKSIFLLSSFVQRKKVCSLKKQLTYSTSVLLLMCMVCITWYPNDIIIHTL